MGRTLSAQTIRLALVDRIDAAVLVDAGSGNVVVVDLDTGEARRVRLPHQVGLVAEDPPRKAGRT